MFAIASGICVLYLPLGSEPIDFHNSSLGMFCSLAMDLTAYSFCALALSRSIVFDRAKFLSVPKKVVSGGAISLSVLSITSVT